MSQRVVPNPQRRGEGAARRSAGAALLRFPSPVFSQRPLPSPGRSFGAGRVQAPPAPGWDSRKGSCAPPSDPREGVVPPGSAVAGRLPGPCLHPSSAPPRFSEPPRGTAVAPGLAQRRTKGQRHPQADAPTPIVVPTQRPKPARLARQSLPYRASGLPIPWPPTLSPAGSTRRLPAPFQGAGSKTGKHSTSCPAVGEARQ